MKRQNREKPRPFTEGRIRKFHAPADGYALYRDAAQEGLAVRVTANGARSYVFEKRVKGGNTMRSTIGAVENWKLGDARAEARRLAVLIDQRKDPRIEAAAERQEAQAQRLDSERSTLVLSGVWAEYLKAQSPRWGERHRENHAALAHAGGEPRKRGKGRTMAGPLAVLMPLKLSELTAERIAIWLKRETRTRSTSAAQAFRALRAFIRWTADVSEYRGLIPSDAYSARAVREVVPRSRTKEGDCLQREQLAPWFKAVRARSNPVISSYLQALLLTGARREELATLRWADVDFGIAPSVTMRDKVDGRRTVPLTPYLAQLLQGLQRRAKSKSWVFESAAAKSGRLVEPRIAHDRALEAAGLPHISLHGLRRSFGTLAEWVEIPTGVVAQIQGHKPSAIAEKHYRRRPLDLLRMWHEKLEAWILEQAGVAFVKPGEKPKLGVVSARGKVQPAA